MKKPIKADSFLGNPKNGKGGVPIVITFKNKKWSIKELADTYDIKEDTLRRRLKNNWTIEEVLQLKIRPKRTSTTKGVIYIITNTQNKKVYIGLTTGTISTRFRARLSNANRGRSSKLYDAIRKIGHKKFSIVKLCSCRSYASLCKKEVFYINRYQSVSRGYNSNIGGILGGPGENGSYCQPITFKGKDYYSINSLARHLSLSPTTIRTRIKNKTALDAPLNKGQQLIYKNKKYKSIAALATFLKVNKITLQGQIKNNLIDVILL